MKKLFFSGMLPVLLMLLNGRPCFGQGSRSALPLPPGARLPVTRAPDPLSPALRRENNWLEASKVDLQRIKRQLDSLEAERARYLQAQQEAKQLLLAPAPEISNERAQLQLRVRELLLKLQEKHGGKQKSWSKAPNPLTVKPITRPGVMPPLKTPSKTGSPLPDSRFPGIRTSTPPVSPEIYAESLFQKGDYQGAIDAFRKVDLKRLKPEERAPIQYFIATSYVRLGKLVEGREMYRRIVASRSHPTFVASAEYQLEALEEELNVRKQVESIRRRVTELKGEQP